MSWAARRIRLADTAKEKSEKQKRQEWMDRVQWRMCKGCVNPNQLKEFQRLYDAMKQSGDESELQAWITRTNSCSK